MPVSYTHLGSDARSVPSAFQPASLSVRPGTTTWLSLIHILSQDRTGYCVHDEPDIGLHAFGFYVSFIGSQFMGMIVVIGIHERPVSYTHLTPVGEYPIVNEPSTFKIMGAKDPGAPDWSELEVFQRLSEITNINFEFEAVSYTHLDVYKRQPVRFRIRGYWFLH